MFLKGITGNPEGINQYSGGEPKDRFRRQFIILPNGCWQWIGTLTYQGYGKITIERRTIAAHRISYLWHVGNIPKGVIIHHRCKNKACVNPEHLELMTCGEHSRHHLYKPFCKRGHAMVEENMLIRKGQRTCRTCDNMNQRLRYHLKRKAAVS